MKKRKTIIQPGVYNEAEKIHTYINENSPQNASKFAQELIQAIDKVEQNPEGFPQEPYLITKKRIYRFAIVMQSWKLIFKISAKLLIFLGIVHTSRHQKEIQKLNDNLNE